MQDSIKLLVVLALSMRFLVNPQLCGTQTFVIDQNQQIVLAYIYLGELQQ
jgi:hypothetical protein